MTKKNIAITVLTLFPEFISDYAKFGIVQRAIKQKLVSIEGLNLRKFGLDTRKTVDDRPYGGGVGMVLRPDVLYKAIQKAKGPPLSPLPGRERVRERVILLTPQGKTFKQKDARRLAKYDKLVLVCGRYEGFDERIRKFVDEEISVGDYVLMGGELPALVITETVLRMIPGVVGKFESTENESFSTHMLEYPQYTKPETWEVSGRIKNKELRIKKLRVPKVLLSGNHAKINEWRKMEANKRTKKRRPDLLLPSPQGGGVGGEVG